jgi:predicted membrane protein
MGGAIFGLLLIGGGLLFLLRNLGIVYFDNIWSYWPVILIALGVSKLASGREVLSGTILTGIGSLFLLRNLGIVYGNIWGYIWPGVIIAVGVSMLTRNMWGPSLWSDSGGSGANPTDENTIATDVIFGEVDRKIVSQSFEGGRVSVVFGGAEIDLRGAAIQQPDATLHADAVFGGVDVIVPESWLVEVRGSGVFGGYEDRTHHPSALAGGRAQKLIVKGGAVFGGVTVRN